MGMAIVVTEAQRVSHAMFIVPPRRQLSGLVQDRLDAGLLYPPQSRIFETSLHVADSIIERAAARNRMAGRH